VQAEEEGESTLFMASTAVIKPIVAHVHPSAVHLDEGKLFIQLGENRGSDGARWILDLGVTNHMMGMRATSSEIDLRVHGIIHFGNGSETNIEGRGTILIKCKTGGHTSEQNGVVERRNQLVLGMARSMLKAMSMSSWFWGEVAITAVFILNRSPTQSIDWMTPYEYGTGSSPQ
jgi:hypothetical protein